MTDPLRIGILGCADIARRRMLPAIAREPGAELVAVASRDPERAARTAAEYGCRPVHGYAALLGLPEVDAVYVPLPAALHAPWTRRALGAGKHVLSEKPLATNASETRELLAAARGAGRVLMENVMFVHHPQHAVVRELVAQGAIGVLQSFTATFTVPRRPVGDIRHRADLGGGALLDMGIYPVRAAQLIVGTPLSVAGAVLHRARSGEVDVAGAALLYTAGGVTVQLDFGMDHAYRSGYELCGSEGRIRVGRAFAPAADEHPVLEVERAGGPGRVTLEPHDQVAATVRSFVDACRGDAVADDRSCLHQAALLDEIRRAAGGS
ncbi:Gfo/Idh/MocA family protein [Streptomyces sp. HD]|uniref:Gfo/Idh/MocA family protein n=1 Tax=Streptomyces sp. HD TaxID=3020892 RepID=UPI00232F3E80|nr:Gfo/Idh/MocA family oxidoreductase [Streptomyces sp. HD]MDC0772610.1 Gfo/Idh/MocA family oxidoreductase [Streptomyces sp. HD]